VEILLSSITSLSDDFLIKFLTALFMIIGLVCVFFPGTIIQGSRISFLQIASFFVQLFPEKRQPLASRIFGILFLMAGGFLFLALTVGKRMENIDKFHGLASPAASKFSSPNISGVPSVLTPTPSTAEPQGDDLATADRLLKEAARKWDEKDYDSSIKLAERAVEIRERILGEKNIKVIEAKYQLTRARQAYIGIKMSPP
jgi:hypothetical protein